MTYPEFGTPGYEYRQYRDKGNIKDSQRRILRAVRRFLECRDYDADDASLHCHV